MCAKKNLKSTSIPSARELAIKTMSISPASRVFHSGFMREIIMGHKAKTLYPKRMNTFSKGLFKIRQLDFRRHGDDVTTTTGSEKLPNHDGDFITIKPHSKPTDHSAYGISHYGNTWHYIEIHDVKTIFDQKAFDEYMESADRNGLHKDIRQQYADGHRYLFEGTKVSFTLYDRAMKQKLKKTLAVLFQFQYGHIETNVDYTSEFVCGTETSCQKCLFNCRPYLNWERRRDIKLYQSAMGVNSKTAMCLSSLALEPITKPQIERERIEEALYLVGSLGGKTKWDWISNVHADVYKPKPKPEPKRELTIKSKPHTQPPSHKPQPKLTKK